jgi:hypothetical protein
VGLCVKMGLTEDEPSLKRAVRRGGLLPWPTLIGAQSTRPPDTNFAREDKNAGVHAAAVWVCMRRAAARSAEARGLVPDWPCTHRPPGRGLAWTSCRAPLLMAAGLLALCVIGDVNRTCLAATVKPSISGLRVFPCAGADCSAARLSLQHGLRCQHRVCVERHAETAGGLRVCGLGTQLRHPCWCDRLGGVTWLFRSRAFFQTARGNWGMLDAEAIARIWRLQGVDGASVRPMCWEHRVLRNTVGKVIRFSAHVER